MSERKHTRGIIEITVITLLFGIILSETAMAGRGYTPPAKKVDTLAAARPVVPIDTMATDSITRPILAATDGDVNAKVGHSDLVPVPQTDKAKDAESSNKPILPGMTVSGFMEVAGAYNNSGQDHSDFSVREAELDMASQPTKKVSLATCLVLNTASQQAQLYSATVGINLYKAEGGFLSTVGVTAGKFDVRYGINYLRNAANTRKLSTTPLAVVLTHGAWVDMGVQFDMAGRYGNFAAYVVNGFTPSADVTQRIEQLATDLGKEIDVTPSSAVGTRLGIVLFPNFELGGSCAVGFNKSNQDEMLMTGADLSFTWSKFDVRSEYIFHSIDRSVLKENNSGFYVQPTCTIGRVFLTARYDLFKAETQNQLTRTSIGCGYTVTEGVELRLETVLAKSNFENGTIMQVVAGF
jgi:hypothetical protein